jgi:hypothetical protein
MERPEQVHSPRSDLVDLTRPEVAIWAEMLVWDRAAQRAHHHLIVNDSLGHSGFGCPRFSVWRCWRSLF